MSQQNIKNDLSHNSPEDKETIQNQVITLFNQILKTRNISYQVTGKESSLLDIDSIDSILLIEVVFKLEDQFDLSSNLHKFDPQNFKSVEQIVDLILKRDRNGRV